MVKNVFLDEDWDEEGRRKNAKAFFRSMKEDCRDEKGKEENAFSKRNKKRFKWMRKSNK